MNVDDLLDARVLRVAAALAEHDAREGFGGDDWISEAEVAVDVIDQAQADAIGKTVTALRAAAAASPDAAAAAAAALAALPSAWLDSPS